MSDVVPTVQVTRAQIVVLRLVANGMTSRQIGARIGRTREAVDMRLKYACAALGAKSRTHAVALCLARGLIRPEEIVMPDCVKD